MLSIGDNLLDCRNKPTSLRPMSDRIRELIAKRMDDLRLNKREVSLKLGLNHAYMQQFLEGRSPAKLPENVREKLAPILGVEERELRETGPNAPPMFSAPKARQEQAGTEGSIPILGLGQGGREGWEMWNGEVVAYVPRPVILAGVSNAYGIYVAGGSMEPRYHPGEMVYVNPGKPPQIGNYVVVQLHPLNEADGPRALIKRLIKRTGKKTTFEQYSPAETFDIPNDEIKSMHRIVGSSDA